MRLHHLLLTLAIPAGLAVLAPAAAAQAPDRGRGREQPQREQPQREQRPSQPEARPRQDPPPRAEPARGSEAERRPPARSTGEPELRRRKP